MFRRVVVSSTRTINGLISFAYYVRGAKVLTENYVVNGDLDTSIEDTSSRTSVVFNSSVRFFTYMKIAPGRQAVYTLDVSENQPDLESVRNISNAGFNVTVYNANGVVVCDNGVTGNASIPSQSATVSDGMTSEPIDGTGEMTSEPIDGTGEMTREPIDGTGEMI